MAYGHVILPGTIMIKHPFLLHTPKIRARSPQWLTGVRQESYDTCWDRRMRMSSLYAHGLKKGAKKGGERKEKQSTFTHHIIHIMGWVGTVSS